MCKPEMERQKSSFCRIHRSISHFPSAQSIFFRCDNLVEIVGWTILTRRGERRVMQNFSHFAFGISFFEKTSANLTGRQRRLAMQNFSNFAKRQKPPKASGIWGAGQRAKGLLEENWAKFLKPPARLHYVLRRRTSKESFKFDNRAILRQPKTLLIWGRINKSTINLQPYSSAPDLYLRCMKSLYGLGLREWIHYIVGSGLFGAVCWWMGQIGGNLAIADLPVLRCWAGEDIGHTGVFF